jgi:hypothetical protein
MAQDFLPNDLVVKGFVSANPFLSAGTNLLDIFISPDEQQIAVATAINALSSKYLALTGGQITGNIFLSGSVFADAFSSPGPSLISFDTAAVSADTVVYLPFNANDVELVTTYSVNVTAFMNGMKGVLYTLTNKGPETLTLSATEKILIRNHPVSLQLQPNFSCSLRGNEDNRVSIW